MKVIPVDVRGKSHVRLWADRLLLAPNKAGAVGYGISLIGPEQSIRALSGGMVEEHVHNRPQLVVRTGGEAIEIVWVAKWKPLIKVLGHNLVHLVAVAPSEEGRHVVAAESESALRLALYRRLLSDFSTPLLPLNVPGQHPAETAAAATWMRVITDRLISDLNYSTPLLSPAELDNPLWGCSLLLTAKQAKMDKMVSGMVRTKLLEIPDVNALPADAAVADLAAPGGAGPDGLPARVRPAHGRPARRHDTAAV